MTGYLVIESVEEKSDKYLYGFLLLGFKPVQHSGVSQKRNGTLMNK